MVVPGEIGLPLKLPGESAGVHQLSLAYQLNAGRRQRAPLAGRDDGVSRGGAACRRHAATDAALRNRTAATMEYSRAAHAGRRDLPRHRWRRRRPQQPASLTPPGRVLVSRRWTCVTIRELLPALALAVALAASAGLRAWLPAAASPPTRSLGCGPRPLFQFLASNKALIVLGVATVIEVAGDKIPAVDHFLDAIGTPLRPAAGALLASSVLGTVSDPLTAIVSAPLSAPLGARAPRGKVGAASGLHRDHGRPRQSVPQPGRGPGLRGDVRGGGARAAARRLRPRPDALDGVALVAPPPGVGGAGRFDGAPRLAGVLLACLGRCSRSASPSHAAQAPPPAA